MEGLALPLRHYLLLVVLCLVSYWNSTRCGFVFDDFPAVVNNHDVKPHASWLDMWSNDFWGMPLDSDESHRSYRPLTTLTFRLQGLLHHGRSPDSWSLHLMNVVLHTAVTTLYLHFLYRLHLGKEMSLTATVLFAVHPVHTEAVTGVVGRAELLSALFFLLTIMSFLSEQTWLKNFYPLLALAATFSKEQGITVLPVCMTFLLFFFKSHLPKGNTKSNRKSLMSLVAYVMKQPLFWTRASLLCLFSVVILMLRLVALRSGLPKFSRFDNPASAEDFPSRHLTYCYVYALNFWLLVCPDWLLADWTMGTIPVITVGDPRNVATVAFFASLLFLLLRALFSNDRQLSDNRILTIALTLYIWPTLLTSNLLFPVGFVVAERTLYLPSMGFCILISVGYHKLKKLRCLLHYNSICFCFLVAVIAVFTNKCIIRNGDWLNDRRLFLSALKVTTANAKVYNNLGHTYEAEGRWSEAQWYFLAAAAVQPDDIGSWINIGLTYSKLNQLALAEEAYLKAMKLFKNSWFPSSDGDRSRLYVAPSYFNLFLGLGSVYKRMSRPDKAERLYREAISYRPQFDSSFVNLGELLVTQNRTSEALKVLLDGLKYNPHSLQLLYNTGVAYAGLKLPNEALKYFGLVLDCDPRHYLALINAATVLSRGASSFAQHRDDALRLVNRAADVSPGTSSSWMEVGSLYYSLHDLEKAKMCFQKALTVDVDAAHSLAAMYSLAVVENELGNTASSAHILQQILLRDPGHSYARLYLCEVFLNRSDFHGAEGCLVHVLRHDRDNIGVLHNLCITLINTRRTDEAAECIKSVKKLMKPNSPYNYAHLKVLEQKFNELRRV